MIANFDDVLSKFRVAKTHGNHVQCYCPSHDDRNASLSITIDGDRMLMYCFAGCRIEDILKAGGLTFSDLFLGDKAPTQIYQYRNPDGTLSHEKLRYQTAKGKTFKQRRLDGDRINDSLEGVPRIPYNLPALQQAIKQGSPIIYCEGEKDADIAELLGFTGTTMGGASDWRDEYNKYFHKASVILVPDKDSAGLTHISKVQKSLTGVCKSLKCVVLPEGKDLTEWVERGYKDLGELIKTTPELIINKSIPEPGMETKLNGYIFSWNGLGLKIIVDRIRNDDEGEISIIENDRTIYISGIKLLSVSHKTSLARALKTQRNLDWDRILNQVSTRCLTDLRQGQPMVEVYPRDDAPAPEKLLGSIIYKGVQNIIFGEKGSAKSTLAYMLAICVGLPWPDNPLQVEVPARSIRTLVLDWETDQAIFEYYMGRLLKGGEVPMCPVYYRRCNVPLRDDIENIANQIEDKGIELLIIDSLGAAAGGERGELKGSEAALQFNTALRRLGITSLIIGQTSKSSEGEKRKTIFGSTYFTYYARNILELCRGHDDSDDVLHLGLFHRESNLGKKMRPMGIGMTFDDVNGGISLEREPLSISEFMEKVSVNFRILEVLKSGPRTAKELQEYLGVSRNAVDQSLRRLRLSHQIVDVGGKRWGLLII